MLTSTLPELLAGFGSKTLAGAVTVALLVTRAGAEPLAVIVKVIELPAGTVAVVLSDPLPLLGPVTLAPPALPDTAQVKLLSPAGIGSEMVTPVAVPKLAPAALETVRVYVKGAPITGESVEAVLVTLRSELILRS